MISVSSGADSQTEFTRGLVSSVAQACTEFDGRRAKFEE